MARSQASGASARRLRDKKKQRHRAGPGNTGKAERGSGKRSRPVPLSIYGGNATPAFPLRPSGGRGTGGGGYFLAALHVLIAHWAHRGMTSIALSATATEMSGGVRWLSRTSPGIAAAQETFSLADAGVMAKRTMKAFDEMCLTPVEDMPPEKIRALRLRENASQAVFARHLNVTAGLVSQWERGEKRPRGASLKLLTWLRRTASARLREAGLKVSPHLSNRPSSPKPAASLPLPRPPPHRMPISFQQRHLAAPPNTLTCNSSMKGPPTITLPTLLPIPRIERKRARLRLHYRQLVSIRKGSRTLECRITWHEMRFPSSTAFAITYELDLPRKISSRYTRKPFKWRTVGAIACARIPFFRSLDRSTRNPDALFPPHLKLATSLKSSSGNITVCLVPIGTLNRPALFTRYKETRS